MGRTHKRRTRKRQLLTGTRSRKQRRQADGTLVFADYPDFRPNLTPREIFKLGSFGGTYWRPITSRVSRPARLLRNVHKQYPALWWRGIPDGHLVREEYDRSINKYGVEVGTSLRFWETKGWISQAHPYGWVHWYCDFYKGKRNPEEDRRQTGRWARTAGPNSRFRRALINMIKRKGARYNDYTVSPKIRQVLQHWGYALTGRHFAA